MMLGELHEPWCSELRSILVSSVDTGGNIGDHVMTYGISVLSNGDSLFGHKVDFRPFHGLIQSNIDLVVESSGCDIPSIPGGTMFGISNAKLITKEPYKIQVTQQSQFWTVSDFERSWQPSYCHFFSGAFEGWSRAIEWAHHQFGLGFSQAISIDQDEDVMKVWSLRNNAPVLRPPFQLSAHIFEPLVGIAANIREHTWVNKCRFLSNFWVTMSPPCISWSMGGRATGLEHDAGMAFVFAIDKIKQLRPMGVAGECADATPKHPHCKFLKALMNFAGYRLVWDSVETLHHLSPMMRNRWLFVWIRNDISVTSVPRTILLKEQTVKSWNDEMYSFFLPDQISHQMKLSGDLLDVYGDVAFLPRAKRSKLTPISSKEDVLRARCHDTHTPLPTLCASYSAQHLLSKDHLRSKGIFAVLQQTGGSYHFIDPFRFCAFLGLPQSQIAVIPCKLLIAFKQIGNAIATPHALATLIIAMNAVESWNLPVHKTITTLWEQRIVADQCIMIRCEDFFVVLPVPVVLVCFSQFVRHPLRLQNQPEEETKYFVVFLHDGTKWEVPPTITIAAFLQQIGIEKPQLQFLCCLIEMSEGSWQTVIANCVDKIVQVKVSSSVALSFRVEALVQPTQEWTQDDEALRSAVIQAEDATRKEPDRVVIFCIGEERPFFTSMHSKVTDDQISKQLDAICNPQGLFKQPCWIECNHHPFGPEIQRCFLVDRHEMQDGCIKYILIVDQYGNGRAAFVHDHQPICVTLNSLGLTAVDIRLNDQWVDSHIDVRCADGDVICVQQSQIDNRSDVESKISSRLASFNEACEKAAVDEFSFALSILRGMKQGAFINPVIDLSVVSNAADVITHLHWALDTVDLSLITQYKCLFPFLLDNHWCAIETSFDTCLTINCIGVPTCLLRDFYDTFVRKVDIDSQSVIRNFLPLIGMSGLCGWTILKRWFQKNDVQHPIVKSNICDRVARAHFSDYLAKNEDDPGYLTFREICKFATCIRALFICHLRTCPRAIVRIEPNPKVGAGTEDVKMDHSAPSINADPWLRYDPWSSRDKPKQCKWEDLRLPSSHPFVGKDSKSVTQVHRQRLTPHSGGVAFTTKSQVQALLQLRPSEPAAILIPAVDPTFFDSLQPKPTTSGPHEVIVVDSANGETYKRQVWMIELTTGISFHLPKPSYQAKLQEVREIVFEVDSRLISKDLNQGFSDKPHDYFKTKIADQFSSTLLPMVNLYAYRKFTPKGSETSHVVHQIMCKVPADKRAHVLEKSGVGCIFVRDYIAKGDKTDDITVIPRFWEVTKQFKDESVKATGGLKGFAGLMISKRGIAARAWTSDIATLRRALLPLDDRLSELNLSVVPRVIRESTGWPSSISPQEIVRATHHALSAAPVPSRCFRSNGVTCWTLAFDKEPLQSTFVAQFNDQLYEILLTPPGFRKQSKIQNGAGKPKKPNAPKEPEPVQAENEQFNDRVSMLEAKFTNLERRQDLVEQKVSNGFDQVQDQLRQILHAVNGRADKSPTGATPPPKFPKTA